MLIMFPTIFAADTKIIYGYNFVAPLIVLERKAMKETVRLSHSLVHPENLFWILIWEGSRFCSIFHKIKVLLKFDNATWYKPDATTGGVL